MPWLLLIVVILRLTVGFIVLTQGSAVTRFIYFLFQGVTIRLWFVPIARYPQVWGAMVGVADVVFKIEGPFLLGRRYEYS